MKSLRWLIFSTDIGLVAAIAAVAWIVFFLPPAVEPVVPVVDETRLTISDDAPKRIGEYAVIATVLDPPAPIDPTDHAPPTPEPAPPPTADALLDVIAVTFTDRFASCYVRQRGKTKTSALHVSAGESIHGFRLERIERSDGDLETFHVLFRPLDAPDDELQPIVFRVGA